MRDRISNESIIVVDWGTTSFRAWLVDAASGAVLETIAQGRGLTAMTGLSFPEYCAGRLAPWREDGRGVPPVLMAGMVGAPSGWRTADQPSLPVGPEVLAAHVVAAEGLDNAWILPGAHRRDSNGDVDVMRGEEVQILGALALLDQTEARFCLPGTHSKWARAEGGRLVDFATFLTGEMHAVLLGASILGQPAQVEAPFDAAAFDAGLAQAAGPEGLLHHVFSSRGRFLYGALPPAAIASFLSGTLIGAELDGALARDPGLRDGPVILVGGAALRAPYERALTARGLSVTWVPADRATIAGVRAVADRMDALADRTLPRHPGP
ncbi:2-dehydro-3-deoxygalactonokinase [Roseospira marina]|uniref:2-dehydro-3-deoxygalactonokinase n=1 Tax=Roseospira marina TaxID=140057 RepID=A0A5M6I937_9PROT|nr:2-dehydro-3-deoxygalactonokinase [Roseospira marina]KAA5604672.1 2-dehydro-3-deoxygalactonokinase [Roseospira marina]MBB4315118.1 2-dehydro-3-deoxygalactonokinase [Roseospira marina]MBB5088112.1 2-dehydro-3-deoxygalactonokinase [Roseospira marina]